MDTVNRELLAIEFKRTQDTRSNYVEKATAVAQAQYSSLLAGLRAVGQVKGWQTQQIVFVVKGWQTQQIVFVIVLLEEQDKVLRSYFAQKGGT